MQVDVVDVLRLTTGVFESDSHRARGFVTIFSQTNPVIRIARSAVSEDLSINMRTAFFRMPELFQNVNPRALAKRSEEHTSELQSHSFISYAVFCLKKKK